MKSLLTSVVTAGLIAGVCPTAAAGSNTAAGAKDNLACFITHAKKNIIRTGVSGAINGKFDFVDMLKNIAVDTVGELAANEIGINRESHGYWTHKIEHGLLGAGLGAVLRHDDPAKGMIAGAAGAIVSEVVAEGLSKDLAQDTLKEFENESQRTGVSFSKDDYLNKLYTRNLEIAEIAKLGGALAGVFVGDVDVASRVANNAIENNYLQIPAAVILTGAITYTAHEVIKTYERDGVEAALIYAGLDVVISAAGVKTFSIAGRTGVAALEYVFAQKPYLKTLLGTTGEKMLAHLGADVASKLPQNVVQANVGVEAGARQFAAKVEAQIVKKAPAPKPEPKPAPKPKAESSPASSSQPGASEAGKRAVEDMSYWNKVDTHTFRGQTNKVYKRDDLIDLNRVDPKTGLTNFQRMERKMAPIGPDNKPINLHHMTQKSDGALAEVTQSFHQKHKKIIHINPTKTPSGINRTKFDQWRESYWKERLNELMRKK